MGPELGILALGAALVIGGFLLVVHPQDMNIPHQGRRTRAFVEHLSRGKAQLYGGCAVLAGSILTGLVFYGRKR